MSHYWRYFFCDLGALFLVILFLQHVGGVTILLKGISYNPNHRKFGVAVSSLGKFLAIGGMIISGWSQEIIIASTILTILITIFATYKHFFEQKSSPKPKSSSA
jgi:hypothetical protein